jgi:hypothetical protein
MAGTKQDNSVVLTNMNAVLKTDISAKSGNEYKYIELTKDCKTNDEFSFSKRLFLDENDLKVLQMIDILDNTKK